MSGRDVLIIEANRSFGTGISSRNSEVIHAGIYYPTSSLKALYCVRGKHLLYEYCAARGIGHRKCGKFIVATKDDEISRLGELDLQAKRNGVSDLVFLSGVEARQVEPELHCAAALWSPSSGIVDSHSLMLSLLGDAENAGATIAYSSPVVRAEVGKSGSLVVTVGGSSPFEVVARNVVNAAGLGAVHVAKSVKGIRLAALPQPRLAKGSYFRLLGRSPFSRLIYPIPERSGLGVHLTLDLACRARFGPDVQWIDAEDYDVDVTRTQIFYSAIRRFWPGINEGALVPDYSGIRPKIFNRDQEMHDFLIQKSDEHEIPALINLLGIESPGLTSCLAIAEKIAAEDLVD